MKLFLCAYILEITCQNTITVLNKEEVELNVLSCISAPTASCLFGFY